MQNQIAQPKVEKTEMLSSLETWYKQKFLETSNLDSRFYFEGVAYSFQIKDSTYEIILKVGDTEFKYTYDKTQMNAYGSKLFIENGQVFFAFKSRPRNGNEMDYSSTIFSLSSDGFQEISSQKGDLIRIQSCVDDSVTKAYLIYNDTQPEYLQIDGQSIKLPDNKYFYDIFKDVDGNIIYSFSVGYEYRLFTYGGGEFVPVHDHGHIEESRIIDGKIYAMYMDKESYFGSIKVLERPDDINSRSVIEGTSEMRLNSIYTSIGPYIIVETYNSTNSFYLTIWDSRTNSQVPLSSINGANDAQISTLFTPSKDGDNQSLFTVLGSNENTLTILTNSSEGQTQIYNFEVIDDELTIRKPDDVLAMNTSVSQVSFSTHELGGNTIGISHDPNTIRSEEHTIYDNRVELITTYGGKSSNIMNPYYPGTPGHLIHYTRGLEYNEIHTHGAQSDYRLTNRIDPDNLPDNPFEFLPSIEMADYLIKNSELQDPKYLIAEGGSFAGMTILLTIVTLIQRFIHDELTQEELIKVFKYTLFSTRSAVMNTSDIRLHNQPYYFSESYVNEYLDGDEKLLEIARYRSPHTSIPAIIKQLKDKLQDDDLLSEILSHLKVSLITYEDDTRCPVGPHRDMIALLQSYGVKVCPKILEGCHHGYYMRDQYILPILQYWAAQNKMLVGE